MGDLLLGGGGEQFGGHGGEHAVVADGVVAQGGPQFRGHEMGIAGGGEQMLEGGAQRLAFGVLHRKAYADTAAERQQVVAAQLGGQSPVTGEHHAE